MKLKISVIFNVQFADFFRSLVAIFNGNFLSRVNEMSGVISVDLFYVFSCVVFLST